ncbi:MAG TPA: serine/threonine-protein kinase, partial [Polyangium sp.]|nr:serine/threonine-protein kinase [Polyangium sp.]
MPPKSHRALAERRVGATLREKYRIERVLGVGGMATVYLGVHRNGHRVAVKILHPELSQSASQRERFIREGYVANSIEHPGAVRVLDDDVAEDGCPFLVIELLDGENLEERRRRAAGKLEVREVLAIGHALCDALAAAHDKGVIHRDIKPENVFIRGDGTLKILDFGIAKVASEDAALGGLAGTPAFMPPEQAIGDIMGPIDGRADLWAAGATMFTLLTGRFVHDGSRTTEFLTSTATKSATPIREISAEIPEGVANVVDKALAYDRQDRFDDAREMRDAISDVYFELFKEPLAYVAPRGSASVLTTSPNSLIPPPRHSMRPAGLSKETLASAQNRQSVETLADMPGTLPETSDTLIDAHPMREEAPPSVSGSINTSGPESTIAPPTLTGAPPPRPARSRAILAAAVAFGMLMSLGVLFGMRKARGPQSGLSETTPQACVGAGCAKPGCMTNLE